MKLGEYIRRLNELREVHGNNIEVVFAIDEEGNDFKNVDFLPEYHEELQGNGDTYKNVICIN